MPIYLSGGGSSGSGIPAGGTTGQVLDKNSNADGDAGWVTPTSLPAQTGNSGKFLTTNGSTTSWGAAGTGSAGALMAVIAYAPSTTAVYSVTSATMTALDTTNLQISFTTNASGPGSTTILLTLQAGLFGNNLLAWGLTGTGAPAGYYGVNNGVGSGHTASIEILATGLTASTTYTWNFAAATNTGTQTVYAGAGSGAVGDKPPALMKVVAGLT